MAQKPTAKKSMADDPRVAQAMQNYEAGLRAMQEHKFDKAKTHFQKVLGGPSKELADRANVHLNTCNQHLEQGHSPVQDAGRALRLCRLADECRRLRTRPRASRQTAEAVSQSRLRGLWPGGARLPDRPRRGFAAQSGRGDSHECRRCASRHATIPTSRIWRKIPVSPNCSIRIPARKAFRNRDTPKKRPTRQRFDGISAPADSVPEDQLARLAALRVVAIGGGTGLSTLLKGLKHFVPTPGEPFAPTERPTIAELCAVVTVSDDGGSSGRLRKEFNMLPPGDIRNCIVALSEDEALLSQLFRHRFDKGSGLEGHSFGNLFLAALTSITQDFSEAVRLSSEILLTRGHIYPATTSNIELEALMEDGTRVRGETNITASKGRIQELFLVPPDVEPLPQTLEAIASADLITIGPGSLFTSLIPNLLVHGIAQAIVELAGDQGLHLQPDDAGE